MTPHIRTVGLVRLVVAATVAAVLVAVGAAPAQAATYTSVTLTVQTTGIPAGEALQLSRFTAASSSYVTSEAVVGTNGTAVFTGVLPGYRHSLMTRSLDGTQIHRQSLGGGVDVRDGTRFAVPSTSPTHTLRFDAKPSAWVTGKVTGTAEAIANARVYVNIWSDVANSWVWQSGVKPAADGTYRTPVKPGARFVAAAQSTVKVGSDDIPYITTYGRGRIDAPSKDDTSFVLTAPAAGRTVANHALALTTLTANLRLNISGLATGATATVNLRSLTTGTLNSSAVSAAAPGTSFLGLLPGRYLLTAVTAEGDAGGSKVLDLTTSRTETLAVGPTTGVIELFSRYDGVAQVGALQTVTATVRGPVPNVTVTTSWTGNQKVLGTGPTYRLKANDLHTYVRAVTLATAPGFMPAVATSTPGYGRLGDPPRATVAPRISGTLATGRTVTVSRGSWDTSASLSPQWTRDGSPIAGATGWSYTLGAADVGHQVDVRISASAAAHASATLVVTGGRSARGAKAAYTAKVTGKAKVGQRITASKAPAGWKASYRWFRNGKVVKGATARTYTVAPADTGARLKVRVTLTRAGYTTTTKTSGSTAKVARTTSRITAKAGKRKATITVRVAGVAAPTGTVTVRHGSTTTKVTLKAKNRGAFSVKLPQGNRTLTVTYSGSKGIAKSSATLKVKVR